MKLKEKFSVMALDKDIAEWEEECEIIADDFAIGFSEWLQENRWYSFIQGKWNYTFEQGTSISEASYDKNYRKTSQELLQIYKKQKGL